MFPIIRLPSHSYFSWKMVRSYPRSWTAHPPIPTLPGYVPRCTYTYTTDGPPCKKLGNSGPYHLTPACSSQKTPLLEYIASPQPFHKMTTRLDRVTSVYEPMNERHAEGRAREKAMGSTAHSTESFLQFKCEWKGMSCYFEAKRPGARTYNASSPLTRNQSQQLNRYKSVRATVTK